VWRKILAGGVCATWYPIIRSIEGLGLIAIAIFTQDPLHTAFLIVIVNAMCLGLFIISRRFWRNPDFRGWTTFSVACGLWPMIVITFSSYVLFHLSLLLFIVNAMFLCLFITSRRFWRNPVFRGCTTFSVACGLWPMIVIPIYGVALNAHSESEEHTSELQSLR